MGYGEDWICDNLYHLEKAQDWLFRECEYLELGKWENADGEVVEFSQAFYGYVRAILNFALTEQVINMREFKEYSLKYLSKNQNIKQEDKMILKNVIVNWAFIAEPDEEGLYRVQFEISKNSADYEMLTTEMQKCMQGAGKKKDDITWWAGFKEHETNPDVVLFNAKTRDEYKDKRSGETKKRTLPVFDIYAKRYPDGDVPRIANGAVCNVEVSPYFASFHNKHGIMLGLRSVQLMQFEVYSQNPYQDETKNQKQSEAPTISYNSAGGSEDADGDKIPF